jgi:manganese efflux pump family protein
VPTLEVFFLAVGLAMDCFAVAVASGYAIKAMKMRHAFTIAAFFGTFQAVMPVLGWLAGRSFTPWLTTLDHWLAFGLLAGIGCKMIYEAFRITEMEKEPARMNLSTLLLLSVATSIDALAVGLSLSILHTPIATPALIIGIVAFVLSFAGTYIGQHMGRRFENKLEALGGLILIGIGIKILVDHLIG